MSEVIAVEVTEAPGGLAKIIYALEQAGVNIEYLYAFVKKATYDAMVILRVGQPEEALKVFERIGTRVLSVDEVYMN